MRRRPAAIACGVAALFAGACAGPQSSLDPAGPSAATIADLWWLMAVGAIGVWLLVMALLLIALRRSGDEAAARPKLFILGGGVVLPTVVLAALLVHGALAADRITGRGSEVAQVIEVVARQWQWEFRHLDTDGHVRAIRVDELHLPRGRLVEFRVRSEDVIHSFWIPRLGGKIDAIPGVVNTIRLRADGDGAVRGQCAEFCGREHATMAFPVRVLAADEYAAWLAAGGDAR
ncbi:cytochrome c oxidase subunit II [Arenimonas composti]|uniref:Cytochrome aa3 subunit 2 n=1 Tax=Arenimonas composti TR7-09 = DSM 18010 TaxID=1121013 RepID=A0A091B0R6_9GAMM|nr:cytochrome c oxidase subunit II [Arenimonas composti]KFN45301.1 hypothetical protein P873_02440 [Arenimonas composti TR7-09 = DSM 18010]